MPSMRLQRALARAGVTSRRKAEELIESGRVSVNGSVAHIGQSVDPKTDVIEVEGRRVVLSAEHQWFAINKPAGVLTSASDQRGRRTVFDLLSERPAGLTYVGRLDYLTEGLLLLTTDGEAVHRLTHPSSEVSRVYEVLVRGDGKSGALAMRRGVRLETGVVRPRDVVATNTGRGTWLLQLTIAEGKNREVRRLCEAVGLAVEKLVRTSFGPIQLGNLASGKVRRLTKKEISDLELASRSRNARSGD
jgi:23S rRNA pseudouridine2605 synthase